MSRWWCDRKAYKLTSLRRLHRIRNPSSHLIHVTYLGVNRCDDEVMARPTPVPSFLATKGIAESLLSSVMVIIVAFAEETVFRGYLSLRFKAVTESPSAPILLSAVIFSLGHGYEGSAGVITVGVMELLFDLVYVWRQSLVAPMVMHFSQDFTSIILLPLLGMK